MKSHLKLLILLPMLMDLVIITISAFATPLPKLGFNYGEEPVVGKPGSLRGTGGFFPYRYRWNYNGMMMTCDKYPKVCGGKGSPGPSCCNKKCVNVKTDRVNCGKCGKKCKYSEICCKGKCVNTMFDKNHCGSCDNRCKKGSKCFYGMCSYA